MSIPIVLAFALPALGCSGGGDTASTRPEGEFDIDGEALFGWGGLALSGTVTFAPAVGRGTLAQVGLTTSATAPRSAWLGEEIFDGQLARADSSVRFRITNLNPNTYWLYARIDASGDGAFANGQPGDLGGYFAGTTESPVLEPAAATPIPLHQNLDVRFGAAAIP